MVYVLVFRPLLLYNNSFLLGRPLYFFPPQLYLNHSKGLQEYSFVFYEY
jgi:hypothetical protein